VLSIDSPGGTVDGTKELADYISRAKSKKPIVTYADGTMASAAYWIGSAGTKIVTFDTAKLGSVGVMVAHQETSELQKKLGVKTTYIYQGKYKTVGNPSEPLTDEGKKYIQDRVDTYYEMFVDAVAANRGIERDVVVRDIALGSIFIGKNAVDINLADSVGNLDDAIILAHQLGEEKMNIEQLTAQVSDLTNQVESLTTQLETVTAENLTLTEQLETAQAEIQQRDQAEAASKRKAEITAKFNGLKVSAEFIDSLVGMNDAVIESFYTEISTRQKSIDSQLASFTDPTDDATSQHSDISTPTSIDAAVSMIEQRDNCDVEEATAKAEKEFPDLFKQ
jgi:signal peptide peptidase SppA